MPGPLMVSKPSSFAKTTDVETASRAVIKNTSKICLLILFISNAPFLKLGRHPYGWLWYIRYTGEENQVPSSRAGCYPAYLVWAGYHPALLRYRDDFV